MQDMKDCNILIIDNDLPLLDMLKITLLQEGFSHIYTASSCRTGKQVFEKVNPHIVILDVTLPDGDGFSLMQSLHQISVVPILFLSSRTDDETRLLGLELGADDYMTKPFIPRELILRLNIILKHTYSPTAPSPVNKPTFQLDDITIDLNSGNVIRPNGTLTLTAKEYTLLEKLYANRNHIITIDALCHAAWDDYILGYENTLMVHIRRLRAKIEPKPSRPQFLLTVRGLGYKLVVENQL